MQLVGSLVAAHIHAEIIMEMGFFPEMVVPNSVIDCNLKLLRAHHCNLLGKDCTVIFFFACFIDLIVLLVFSYNCSLDYSIV